MSTLPHCIHFRNEGRNSAQAAEKSKLDSARNGSAFLCIYLQYNTSHFWIIEWDINIVSSYV